MTEDSVLLNKLVHPAIMPTPVCCLIFRIGESFMTWGKSRLMVKQIPGNYMDMVHDIYLSV